MGKSNGRKKTRSPRPRPFKIPSDEHASASELHQSNDTGVRDQLAQALEKLDRRLTDLEKRLSCLEIVAPRTQVPVGASFEFDQPHLEKRSCQLFYYCVHMARKTTPLYYVSFYVRCSVFHLGYVSLYVRCSVLDLPTGGSRVRCTCTADIVLHACSAVRVRTFGCACARNFLLWNCFLYELFRIFRLLAWLISFRRC